MGQNEHSLPRVEPILVMRVAWASPPSMVDVPRRRALRRCVTAALEDTGYLTPTYRRDGGAGCTVALLATHERPSLTASVFLDAVDYGFAEQGLELRFLAHLAQPTGQQPQSVNETVADLDTYCGAARVKDCWDLVRMEDAYIDSRPTAAIVHGIDPNAHHDLRGVWSKADLEVPWRKGAEIETFWYRTNSSAPF